MSAKKDFTDEERDELTAFCLREKLGSFDFTSKTWKAMQAEKWTHQSSRRVYHPPNPPSESSPKESSSFESMYPTGADSKQLEEFFDQYALPEVRASSLEAPQHPKDSKRNAKLRQDLLIRLYYGGQNAEDPEKLKEQQTFERLVARQQKAASEAPATNAASASGRAEKSSKTAVSFEHGADLYFSKGKKGQKRKSLDSATVDDRLDFPMPSVCVENVIAQYTQVDPPQNEFELYKFQLETNHSLLFYGFGSKRTLLNAFAKRLRRDGDVLSINGYDREVSIDGILDLLRKCFLKGKEPVLDGIQAPTVHGDACSPSMFAHELVKRAAALAQELCRIRKRPVFLVLHNIDGSTLRSVIAQEALGKLVACSTVAATGTRTVRLVASIDHVNAPMLWDGLVRRDFNWMWNHVDSSQYPYFNEVLLGFDEAQLRKSRSTRSRSSYKPLHDEHTSLQLVLQTLAPRHTEALQVLAGLQLESCGNKKYTSSAVDYITWREHCQNKMVVADDSSLRVCLSELMDHGIIEKIEDPETERVVIPQSKEKLKEILGYEVRRGS